ncbi:solute carrier family 25 member 36-A [Brachionus plicatilis]|uniref:Solute carrier family 25 member 36-A n=1 Tax=Brachionus plicatilis TaxID=10195 RepID=A0A3M7SEN8_BRAPC|nr:solute carrier family 25 member 36-A [Brachionus plicatilis]
MTDQNIFIHLVAGGLAGTTGAILTCPLEVVKTRLQANQNSQNSIGFTHKILRSHTHLSPIHLGFASHKCSSITKTATILYRNSHGTSSHLLTNDFAFTSRITSIENPTKNLAQNHIGKNIVFSFRSIIENEGYRGLFKGLGPTIIGVAPYRAIYFFTYANSKRILSNTIGEKSSILHIISAFIAGFSAVTITNPIWFIKTRMQLDQSRRGQSAMQVIEKIMREKGPLGFYKGISASYFGIAESALYFVLYEKLKSISTDTDSQLSVTTYFTSAGFSKTLAALICYPHEVARTRLRLEGDKYTGFFQSLALIAREEGFRGWYKGMGTHLIRQIPNTAIVMTTYELIVHYFSKCDTSSDLLSNDVEE